MTDWFAPTPQQAKIEKYSWFRQNWFDWHAQEHKAAREDVILMDMSLMSKFIIQGRDACALMSRLSCNEVDVDPGKIVYTQWVNEAGLGFAVKLDKEGGFIGRDALAAIKEKGIPSNRMLQFLLKNPEPLLHGNELIYLNGEAVGTLQIGAYGHTLGAAVGIGFARIDAPLTADIVNNEKWEIDIAGERFEAQASLRPLYDATMERVKC